VLQARLLDEQPDRVAELHRRASDWYEQHGDRAEAIGHALAGGHAERAADLVELAVPDLRQARQDATIRGYLEALPTEVYGDRPVLTVESVGAVMVRGEVQGVAERLDRAQRLLDDPPPTMVVVDEHEFARLPGQIAMYRTGLAHLASDMTGVIANAQRLLDLVDDEDHLGRGAAQAFLALAHWALGDLDAAEAWERESIASMERVGHVSDALGCSLALADIQVAQGHLGDAVRTLERGLALAEPGVRGTADMHVALSELHRERDDLAAARRHLVAARELGEHAGLPQNPYRWRVAMAGVLEAEGDRAAAVDLLDEAEPLYDTDFSPAVRPVAAVRARVWVRQGDAEAALRWARQRELSAGDDLTYLREYEHLTLARALLASGAEDEATGLLDRLQAAAEEGGRRGSVIEIRALQALAHGVRGDRRSALATLVPALALAEVVGWCRVFLDEGPPMAALLEAAGHAPAATGGPAAPGLVEPLSERELDVLRLLRTDLSGPEIARELIVSVNTLRTHTRHIFDKLGVNSRRAAVRRADELGL
jgi:LuxR family maltose regulon positive regulatory protein